MTGRARLLTAVRRRWAIVTAVVAATAIVVPLATPSTASWNDDEWASGSLGTSSFDCGADTDYTTTASSRFLSGSLAGVDLDSVASVQGVDVVKNSTDSTSVDPVTAPVLGTPTETTAAYGNPLDVGLLGDVLGLDLTGLGLGLPAGSTGAVNQMAKSSATGEATAAAGLVSDSGGVLVTDATPSDELPEPASLDVGQALPAVAGVADVGLQVGAVGSSAQLDGCDQLENQIWGAATSAERSTTSPLVRTASLVRTTADVPAAVGPSVTRDYGVASLALQLDSPLVGSLVQSVNTTVSSLDSTLTTLVGTNGTLSEALQQNIVGALTNGLGLGTVTGTVAIDGLDLSAALAPLLTQPLTDGTLTVDLSAGTVDVDLAHLLGDDVAGLNDLPPNTEIALDAALLNGIATRLGTLLDTWTQRVTTLITTLLRNLTLRVALSVNLNLLGIPLVQLAIGLNTGIGALMDTRGGLTIGTKLLGLDLGGVGSVVSALVNGLLTGLPAVLVSTLTTTLFALVGTLGSTIATVARPLVTAVASLLSFLPGVLSLQVNVQSDTVTRRDGTIAASGVHSVTALRIGLLSGLIPGGLAHVDLARSVVGPSRVDLRG